MSIVPRGSQVVPIVLDRGLPHRSPVVNGRAGIRIYTHYPAVVLEVRFTATVSRTTASLIAPQSGDAVRDGWIDRRDAAPSTVAMCPVNAGTGRYHRVGLLFTKGERGPGRATVGSALRARLEPFTFDSSREETGTHLRIEHREFRWSDTPRRRPYRPRRPVPGPTGRRYCRSGSRTGPR